MYHYCLTSKFLLKLSEIFNKVKRKKTFISYFTSNRIFEIKSDYELAASEVRTLNRSFTFEHRVIRKTNSASLQDNSAGVTAISIDLNGIKQLLLAFNGSCPLEKEIYAGFELVVIDILGNVFKKKFYFHE